VAGISVEEYGQRLSWLQQHMVRQGLDALVIYSWKRSQVRYVSGYHPNYVANVAMLVVPLSGEPTLLIRFPFDLERARRMSWLADVRASGDLPGLARDGLAVLLERGGRHACIGLVTGDHVIDEMPHSVYDVLQVGLPGSEFVSAIPLLEHARLRKSPAEADLTRRSARLADAALAATAGAVQPGRSEYEVIAAAEATARAGGAEAVLTVIAPAACELIGPPKTRLIGEAEMLVVEFAAQLQGYYSQVAGVFHTGRPTAEQQEMYRAAHQGYLTGMRAARPGHTVGDVARAELAVLEQTGWLEWQAYDLGHGDGLDHPEAPAVLPTSEVPIEAGMVLCIHPGLRKPGVGGVFVGGTVLVDEQETVPLHQVPPALS
jgi:Xaa-Pro aminopeptidase